MVHACMACHVLQTDLEDFGSFRRVLGVLDLSLDLGFVKEVEFPLVGHVESGRWVLRMVCQNKKKWSDAAGVVLSTCQGGE